MNLIKEESGVLAAITGIKNYVDARNQAEKLSLEHGLTVAGMPLAIQAMDASLKIRKAIREAWIDTISCEYHGLRDGDRSYEVWHSAGSLATVRGLEELATHVEAYGFMPISDHEWTTVGNGEDRGISIARLHLEDIRKGNVPAPGTPYTIFVRLDKDSPKINGMGQLGYDNFMQDDRVLMVTGSLESREALAKLLFGKKKEGGEGWTAFGSYHRINDARFDAKAKGRPLVLCGNNVGLCGGYLGYIGRFAVVREH